MILVRRLTSSEHAWVLASWKAQLSYERKEERWGNGLDRQSFWDLVNYVVDRVSMPSCEVFVASSETEPTTPLCWVAIRKVPGLSTFDVVFSYARLEIRKDPELAATLERALLSEVQKERPLEPERRKFNPFRELHHDASAPRLRSAG